MGKSITQRFPSALAPILWAALAASVVLLAATAAAAQAPTPAAQTQANPPARKASPHPRPAAVHAESPAAAETPAPPPVPEAPHWPVNEQPAQAAVNWDSHGLRIDAANSSLQQILKDVSATTGTKVEGISTDERIFGEYGPGRAQDVLSQLLLGAGYNVIMIGDQGQGAPREIQLSLRQARDPKADAARNGAGNNDEDAADEPEDQQPPQPVMPIRPGFGPGGLPRSQQEMLQERQRLRMQSIQQTPQN
jgi:hypothetical protein